MPSARYHRSSMVVSRVCLLVAAAVTLLAQSTPPDAAGAQFFEAKILPVLANRCYVCHGVMAPKPQGGLRLDSREGLRKGGNSGSPIVAGDPDASLLIKALRYTDPNLKMPPGKSLAPEVVADFEQWVRMGAPDPRTEIQETRTLNKASDWWAFKKPIRPVVPSVTGNNWAKTPIDNFILAGLTEAKLTPAASADKRTLIRRATYDLIGLPPTQKEIDDFTADNLPNAFEKVVDRLLSSPQYRRIADDFRITRHAREAVVPLAQHDGFPVRILVDNACRLGDLRWTRRHRAGDPCLDRLGIVSRGGSEKYTEKADH